MKVGVIGARGRMGSETCRALEETDDLELAARVDLGDSLDALPSAGCEVAVDFTTAQAAQGNVRFCLEAGIHVVVGTTGLGDADLDEIRTWTDSAAANAVVAPNFAVGAVLMMHLAAQAARFFDRAEIVERHHERKLDAPSGTALRTAALMNEARDRPWETPDAVAEERMGSRGTEVGGIHIHALRVPGSVAHQDVILGGAGQTLTLRHDSIDRTSFMPGVLLAVREVPHRRGLTVGLEKLLDL